METIIIGIILATMLLLFRLYRRKKEFNFLFQKQVPSKQGLLFLSF